MRRSRQSPARHIVLARHGASLDACAEHVERSRGRVLWRVPLIHGLICTCPGPATLASVAGHPDVESVEPDSRLPLPRARSAPAARALAPVLREMVPWGAERIGAPRAWTRSRGEGVRVAIIDTGVDWEHPDLAENVKGGLNLLDPGRPPEDDNGHGTHVAGIVAARDGDGGVVGVAPRCELYALKAFDASGYGTAADVLLALQWCVQYGMHVANLSFGQDHASPALARAVQACDEAGLVLVAAAGNDGRPDSVDYPARHPHVLAVTAATRRDRLLWTSSRGPEVDLIAPGRAIPSLGAGGGIRTLSGTSMAAPHVTGAAALLLAAEPHLSPAQVRERLRATAERLPGLGPDEQGAGMVRADRALGVA